MKIVAITQARLSSARFPKKVLEEINGQSLIQIHAARVARSKLLDHHLIATSNDPSDIDLITHCKSNGIHVDSGSLCDVLDRFSQITTRIHLEPDDLIIRLTGDCPFVSPELIDAVISDHLIKKSEYSCLSLDHWPRGFDVEVFSKLLLDKADKETQDSYDREHVTPYVRESLAAYPNVVKASGDSRFSALRMCVDVPPDLQFLKELVGNKTTKDATYLNATELCELAFRLPSRCNEFVKQNEKTL